MGIAGISRAQAYGATTVQVAGEAGHSVLASSVHSVSSSAEMGAAATGLLLVATGLPHTATGPWNHQIFGGGAQALSAVNVYGVKMTPAEVAKLNANPSNPYSVRPRNDISDTANISGISIKSDDGMSGRGTPRSVAGGQFLGMNVVNLQSGNFSSDPDYLASTAALNTGTLRYPGGNLGDWWDWRTGWCVQNASVPDCPAVRNPCFGGRDGGKSKRKRIYKLEEFQLALAATGAMPVLMVNLFTRSLDDQLEFLQHARAIGALPPGTYIELGGEL